MGVGQNSSGVIGQEGKTAERQEVKFQKFKKKVDSEHLMKFVLLAFPSCPPAFLPSCPILSQPLFKVSPSGKIILLLLAAFITVSSAAQNKSFKPVDFTDSIYQVTGKKLIIPAVLTAYGFAQFSIHPMVDLNLRVKNRLQSDGHAPFTIDNYSQYAPVGAVYGLNLIGVKGRHNFLDRSIIIATSGILAGVSVEGIKWLTHVLRPDGSAFNAFPSGHTATAFACAEFLHQEYKDVSVWYGIAGYTVAAGTGFLRMYNNRHWLTDVVAGAGFGILSTKVAYWVFPYLKKHIFKNIRLNFSLIPSTDYRNGPAR
jgi:membrane-associated phospholipid phosphatase